MRSREAMRNSRASRAVSFFAVWLVAGNVTAQVNIDAYRDYFLVGQFGEVCTMCEVIVLCEPGTEPPSDEAVPGSGNFVLYHVQTRTFWSQVSTIWEWFISTFRQDQLAARGHTRPVHVHEVKDGSWQPLQVVEARLTLDPGVLEFGDHKIDRVNRAWQDASSGTTVGYCSRLPLWDALESIEANTSGGQS